jgi:hypothetical protein
MKPISREEMDNLQGLMRTKRNNHYNEIISNIYKSETLDELKDVFVRYIETYRLVHDTPREELNV